MLETGTRNTDPNFIRWFWNQLVFDTHDCPAERCGEPLERRRSHVLSTTGPDFHIRTHDETGERIVTEENVQRIRADIPRTMAIITGEPFRGRILDGARAASRQSTINIEFDELDPDLCGQAQVGAAVVIQSSALSRHEFDASGQGCPPIPVLRHEVAHAMGFFHVSYGGDLMSWLPEYVSDFSEREVHHMQLAPDGTAR